MDHNLNPLKNIKDINTRHMIMQVLSWMWCIIFSMWFGSMWVFGITAVVHIFILFAILWLKSFSYFRRNFGIHILVHPDTYLHEQKIIS